MQGRDRDDGVEWELGGRGIRVGRRIWGAVEGRIGEEDMAGTYERGWGE